jgi:DNA polymerase (family X)
MRIIDHMHWGVEMARESGDRVLNAMTIAGITRYLRQKRPSLALAKTFFGTR